jgi:glycogen phosphorylase
VRKIFERIDPAAWNGLGHNPVALLQNLSDARMAELCSDKAFLAELAQAYNLQRDYLHDQTKTWYQKVRGDRQNFCVAYLSAEYGVASCLRTYSGGLGVLSGDHLKSASDLGIPLVGLGLFYRRGYFSQGINHEGWQSELYPENDPDILPITPVLDSTSGEPLIISVPIADRLVRVRAWKVLVGRVPLYLMDTNIPGLNTKDDCEITAELYGGDSDTRIKQEITLGFGGPRLLRSLGIEPSLFHMNEGHSSFAGLERIAELMEEGRTFHEAAEIVRSSSLFTTHTPVPAGIDIFTKEQIEKYLATYSSRLGISFADVFSLGQESKDSAGFNMAVLAIRLSAGVNAVSKLHRQVARRLWENVLHEERFELEDIHPQHHGHASHQLGKRLGSVTNGVHTSSWISDAMADVLDEFLGKEWSEDVANPEVWRKVHEIPADVLWQIRCRERYHFVQYVRDNFSNIHGHNKVLNPDALTIGFARRFATYKRATLLFSDHSHLERLIGDPERPVQFIFSGKAHPRDHEGKKLIQEINHFTKKEGVRGKILFLPDYDISLARRLVQGVDLWLNNPRRPLEACGTSGMKVVPNGGLNLSILDGWWDEAYTPSNGWSIGTGTDVANMSLQDRQDAESLYDSLQYHVIPEFYERTGGIPHKWVERMKRSMSTLSPRFNSSRMVMEYAQRFYFAAGQLADPDSRLMSTPNQSNASR